MADLIFDVVIDDGADLTLAQEPVIDVDAINGDFVVVEVAGPRGPQARAVCAVLSGQVQNGVNTTFTLPEPAADASSVQVFRNGLMEMPGIGFSCSTTQIIFTSAPLNSDVVAVSYLV